MGEKISKFYSKKSVNLPCGTILPSEITSIEKKTPEHIISVFSGNKKAFVVGVNCNSIHGLDDCISNSDKVTSFLEDSGFSVYRPMTDPISELSTFFSSAKPGDILFVYYCGAGSFSPNKIDILLGGDKEVSRVDTIINQHIGQVNQCTVILLIDDACSGSSIELPYTIELTNHAKILIVQSCEESMLRYNKQAIIKIEYDCDREKCGSFITDSFIKHMRDQSTNFTWKDFLQKSRKTRLVCKQLKIKTNVRNLIDMEAVMFKK